MQVVAIHHAPIELYQLLKIANMVGSGGEAKFVIAEGLVLVNGTVETRKRKKISVGDVIEFNGARVQVSVQEHA